MTIIEIQPQSNGAHRNQTIQGGMACPDGWAIIPADVPIPETYPFVTLTVEGQTVTGMEPGIMPEPEIPAPTEAEQLRADIDYLAAMAGVSL
nr:MAG TPA: hypothetical protein [Caudoviricetes sp.]